MQWAAGNPKASEDPCELSSFPPDPTPLLPLKDSLKMSVSLARNALGEERPPAYSLALYWQAVPVSLGSCCGGAGGALALSVWTYEVTTVMAKCSDAHRTEGYRCGELWAACQQQREQARKSCYCWGWSDDGSVVKNTE